MLPYHGTLSEAHHRAVVRLALRAHGFSVDRETYRCALAEIWRLGRRLRDEVFPRLALDFGYPADELDVADSEPYLWSRLPWMAAAGYLQARDVDPTGGSGEASEEAAQLAALFHTAIVALDFLVDERQLGCRVFERLDEATVLATFSDPEAARRALTRARGSEDEDGVRLVVALVGISAAVGHRLLDRSGNSSAWAELMKLIAQMYAGERAVSRSFYPDREEARLLLPALAAKSALPPVAIACIAALVQSMSGVPASWSERARLLGRIYWLTDDLVDLLSDSLRGVPSGLLVRLTNIAADQRRGWATDGDIYEVVDETAREITSLWRAAKLEAIGPEPVPSHIDFTTIRIAAWTDWDELEDMEDSPTVVPGAAARSNPAEHATRFILAQQADGYREAVHCMTFPRAQAGTRRMETHPALLFQRAVILDALLDAALVTAVPDRVIASEALAILRAKHRGVTGGWNYIPEVPELAPDADDLAAVLEALRRAGGPALASTCEEGISLALEASATDGSFPTWILDPLGRSPADDAIREYLWIGGHGIHPEVVANLLFAVHGYDRSRFADALDRAVTYFESVQERDGTWSSRWYAGPLYGTYRVIAALVRARRSTPALPRAVQAVLARQRADGGWDDPPDDALATGLALLALTESRAPEVRPAVVTGVDHLLALQESDGGWPAGVWGYFETGVGIERYKSRTVTTAYCLKALLAARTRFGPPEERVRANYADATSLSADAPRVRAADRGR